MGGGLVLAALVFMSVPATQAAALQTEDQALAVLQSAANAAEKEAACLRLKQIGSAKSVPALKALLGDESLAQWAADALATMPAREAGEALLQALPGTSGKTQALVILALGVRGEAGATRTLVKLLSDTDVLVATAAAQALGKLGGEPALAALRTARSNATGHVRAAVNDALLALADQSLAAGDKTKARALYAALRTPDEPPQMRAAAFRGLVLSGDGASVVVSALLGAEEAEQVMAVQLVRDLPDRNATQTFAAVLPKLPPLLQVAVLEALRQRADPAAATEIAALVRGASEPAIRLAALKALGELGDAAQVGLLAELAATGPGNERSEARQALLTLHRGEITPAILSEIQLARPEVKIELARALGRRMDRSAVPSLVQLAADADAGLSVAAIQALEKLADDAQMAALLDLLLRARDKARRDAAVSAYAAVGARAKDPTAFSRLALNSLPNANPELRCALLEAAGLLGGPGVLEALRAALKDANPDVRATALRTLSENGTDEARPVLLELARESASEADRALALRGYWRLVEAMTDRGQADRFAAVQAGLAVTSTPADRKLGLARLSELQSREALEAALRYRDDAAVRAEAESACLAIASRLEGADLDAAEKTLVSLASSAGGERVRNEARTAVAKLEERKGFVAPWLVSGPYRQPGKEAQQLFDLAFAPEEPAGKAEWRALAGAGPTMDLLPVAGGDHCIVYLKTRVFSPKAQPVALEIGTDDGVKLWVNGALVHANNAVRGFTIGEDKARATLKEGWNEFLLKVTQHTAGCAASVRVRSADNKAISGLRAEANE